MNVASLLRPTLALACLATVALGVLGACGGPSECEKMGEAICAKACACNGGSQCRFLQPGTGATSTKSEEACRQWFTDTCEGPEHAAHAPSHARAAHFVMALPHEEGRLAASARPSIGLRSSTHWAPPASASHLA